MGILPMRTSSSPARGEEVTGKMPVVRRARPFGTPSNTGLDGVLHVSASRARGEVYQRQPHCQ